MTSETEATSRPAVGKRPHVPKRTTVANRDFSHGEETVRPPDSWWYRCGACRDIAIVGWGEAPSGTMKPLAEYENWRYFAASTVEPKSRFSRGGLTCPGCSSPLPTYGANEGPHPNAIVNGEDYSEKNPRGLYPSDRERLANEHK